MKGIASVFCNFEDEQYLSNSVDPWCLITKYPNEGIGFLVDFGRAIHYPSLSQKICYETQCIYGIP
jgi:hypothetical protein